MSSESAETVHISGPEPTPPMDPSIKVRWCAALDSGEFPQGLNQLQGDVGFCCLGILCHISNLGEWQVLENGKTVYMVDGIYSGTVLPEPVAKWAGLADGNPYILREGTIKTIGLSALNDRGMPFKEISALIKQHL